jgi:uncharacterized phage protein (TIGR01671 family)
MRTIKFRAWDGTKMIYRGLHDRNWYTDDKGGKLVKGTHPDDNHFLKVMENTGLKDKNDKEIYDGDILKVGGKHGFNSELLNEFKEKNNMESINGIGLHFTGIVRIDLLRGLMFENMENKYQEPMFSRHSNILKNHSDIEIIGNIYEIPELLTSDGKI